MVKELFSYIKPANMISIENLTVEFGANPLFKNVTCVIGDRDRAALVGKNGAGKSTLLKIISGRQNPTSGTINKSKDTTIGYLPQVMKLADDHTVREEAEQAFKDIKHTEKEIARMNNELAERTDYESESYRELIEQFTHTSEHYHMMGGANYHAQLERTLTGLGFQREDLDRPTKEFSGGWRMRIELAKILLSSPDILLLDEPTNHLDIESIQWLETFLKNYQGAVVLVSHDRAFINNITNRTIEISCGRIHDYKVTYDEYVRLRKERREQQIHAYENQQKEIQDIEEFIDRFRYKPSKAVQVQSRVKQLEKMEIIEIDEIDNSKLHLRFPPCSRTGDYPLICKDVAKTYGDHNIFHDVNFTINRGDKVAFVGKNGEGKSTLVKCIMDQIPYDGQLKLGHNVEIGYFAQNQAQLLDDELTVFQTIDNVATGEIRHKIRDILGAFMFGGEASDKKVKVLSGGERSRLAMIKLLLEPVNLLILDEPTNHLDMPSKDVLKDAIRDFDGTAIIVSHDRDFLDGLVTKVYEFGGGEVHEHLGGIYDFLRDKQIQSLDELHTQENPSPAPAPHEEISQGRKSYEEMKEYNRMIRRLEKDVKDAEAAMQKIEGQKTALEARMATPEGAADTSLYEQYAQIKDKLAEAEEEWETAFMQLAEAKEE